MLDSQTQGRAGLSTAAPIAYFGEFVVFSSLFGKKKEKDGPDTGTRPARTGSPSVRGDSGAPTTASPLTAPTTTRPAPPANARELARATAEKIDKIESEMSLDFPGRSGASTSSRAPVVSNAAETQAPAAPAKRARRPEGTTTLPSLGQTTDILLGDSILANAMELTDSASSPAVEEAAILYANGQPLPAVAVLTDAIRSEGSAGHNVQAWMMLFELYQILGKKVDFENLAIDYAVRFETSSPAWTDDVQPKASSAPAAQAAPARAAVAFKGELGGNVVPQLDQLKRLAQKHTVLYLDFRAVSAVDDVGADLILRVFAAFQKSNHEIVVQGGENLAERLLAGIEVGRRDDSNAVWMLLLETYRILNRQAAFEETSIDYCVTYEVSPPSWEPATGKFRLAEEQGGGSDAAVAAVEEPEQSASPDSVALSGDLVGKAEADVARLAAHTAEHRRIVVDCRRLRRVDFTAAGVLLNWAVGSQGQKKTIEFKDVSNLVAALFVVMGLHEVSQIERRRF